MLKVINKGIFIYDIKLCKKANYANQYIVFGGTNAGILFLVCNNSVEESLDYETIKKEVYNFLSQFNEKVLDSKVDIVTKLNIGGPDYNTYFEFVKIFGFYAAPGMVGIDRKFVENLLEVYEGSYDADYNYFDNIDDLIGEITVPKSLGVFCRSCEEFNHYGEIDNVINDNKYTCWNCANSFYRVYRGLNCDDLESAVMMIRRNNNIK